MEPKALSERSFDCEEARDAALKVWSVRYHLGKISVQELFDTIAWATCNVRRSEEEVVEIWDKLSATPRALA